MIDQAVATLLWLFIAIHLYSCEKPKLNKGSSWTGLNLTHLLSNFDIMSLNPGQGTFVFIVYPKSLGAFVSEATLGEATLGRQCMRHTQPLAWCQLKYFIVRQVKFNRYVYSNQHNQRFFD